MQVSKRTVLPVLITLAAAITTGCDTTQDVVNASPSKSVTDLGLGDPAYYVSLGDELRVSRRYDDAITSYRKAIVLDMENAEAYTGLGQVLAEQRRSEEAIAAYRRSIEINPRNAAAYSGLGTALAERKRLEEAIAAYRRSLEANPNQMSAYTGLANVLSVQKKFPEAIATYQKALDVPEKTETAQAIALVGLGRALQTQDRSDEAIALFRKAADLAPDYTWSHIFLGHALASAQQFDAAGESYRRVLNLPIERKGNLGNSHAIALNGLGTVLQKQGKVKTAIEQFEKSVEQDLSYEAAQNNLKRAKRLSA